MSLKRYSTVLTSNGLGESCLSSATAGPPSIELPAAAGERKILSTQEGCSTPIHDLDG